MALDYLTRTRFSRSVLLVAVTLGFMGSLWWRRMHPPLLLDLTDYLAAPLLIAYWVKEGLAWRRGRRARLLRRTDPNTRQEP